MKSKLVPAIILGALTGAALSMLDKQTRQHTVETSKKVKDTISYYSQNRDELQELIETKMEQAQSLYADVTTNIASIMEHVDDAKTLPSTVKSLVTETKDAFSKSNT
ncbi:YtxH domain-containing protein [Lysinibacillus louembei]|uniref:YtxH domain-containing protein n=1 Tax=Lysinibacillus louembei TaxID=1470088 RepID=A0ABZ0S1V2_9BACI|nr:YtxH domain-containing protein [Lysinibacillus louembei]WPK13750.1 YtxH domain-containing protein [Lysinibacillus louembei]